MNFRLLMFCSSFLPVVVVFFENDSNRIKVATFNFFSLTLCVFDSF